MNVLISLDGLSYTSFARRAPQFIQNGYSYCKKMITTFPSVTFSAHATAITGNHPDKHSVFDNVVSHAQTLERIELYGDHDSLCNETFHKQTIFYSLARHGVTSCCIHWPLTSGNPYIQHLITESNSKKKLRESMSVNEIDREALRETIQAIESEKYDFIAARFIGYDALSHQHGKDSIEASEYLDRLFAHINQIEISLKKSKQPYNLLLFSDHGQSDIEAFFYPNEILAQSRWREQFAAQQIRFVADGSGALLFYSSLDSRQNKEIMDYFRELPEVNQFYERTKETTSVYQPIGILDLNHMVCGEDIAFPKRPKYTDMKSLHGYHPSQVDEMNGFMVCVGDQLENGKIIEESRLEHIAPTIARLFQISHSCDGTEINEVIREYK
ncbi:alkaline phosphatase family protein [uncultured Brevibacillus sp.]|uniref:alkaline phosphatase family protein n=1 Tax=uncultured Brevibacillus sp. TaxID=169970 RepID=UPI00259A0123|nr:nucleotide pyrophosphatase/phosphodiesterase family protein [uncultured Brevibacillus sp.]